MSPQSSARDIYAYAQRVAGRDDPRHTAGVPAAVASACGITAADWSVLIHLVPRAESGDPAAAELLDLIDAGRLRPQSLSNKNRGVWLVLPASCRDLAEQVAHTSVRVVAGRHGMNAATLGSIAHLAQHADSGDALADQLLALVDSRHLSVKLAVWAWRGQPLDLSTSAVAARNTAKRRHPWERFSRSATEATALCDALAELVATDGVDTSSIADSERHHTVTSLQTAAQRLAKTLQKGPR